ncbi:flagellar hook-length control protein FliK [Thalassococcus sp. BH17M4-6]|uniref:flagellar hook-length control protein FliK n=1 Tax=Thalassococcus sp. BH17M4-6 TaxID=3413148 RepID=UPI003BF469B0
MNAHTDPATTGSARRVPPDAAPNDGAFAEVLRSCGPGGRVCGGRGEGAAEASIVTEGQTPTNPEAAAGAEVSVSDEDGDLDLFIDEDQPVSVTGEDAGAGVPATDADISDEEPGTFDDLAPIKGDGSDDADGIAVDSDRVHDEPNLARPPRADAERGLTQVDGALLSASVRPERITHPLPGKPNGRSDGIAVPTATRFPTSPAENAGRAAVANGSPGLRQPTELKVPESALISRLSPALQKGARLDNSLAARSVSDLEGPVGRGPFPDAAQGFSASRLGQNTQASVPAPAAKGLVASSSIRNSSESVPTQATQADLRPPETRSAEPFAPAGALKIPAMSHPNNMPSAPRFGTTDTVNNKRSVQAGAIGPVAFTPDSLRASAMPLSVDTSTTKPKIDTPRMSRALPPTSALRHPTEAAVVPVGQSAPTSSFGGTVSAPVKINASPGPAVDVAAAASGLDASKALSAPETRMATLVSAKVDLPMTGQPEGQPHGNHSATGPKPQQSALLDLRPAITDPTRRIEPAGMSARPEPAATARRTDQPMIHPAQIAPVPPALQPADPTGRAARVSSEFMQRPDDTDPASAIAKGVRNDGPATTARAVGQLPTAAPRLDLYPRMEISAGQRPIREDQMTAPEPRNPAPVQAAARPFSTAQSLTPAALSAQLPEGSEPDGGVETSPVALGEVRSGSAPTMISHSVPAHAAPPAAVVRQVAEGVALARDGAVELRLNPEELGRVHVRISASETGVMMHVTAERPETLDLLRRHIDLLQRDLNALGYDDPQFSFDRRGGHAEQTTTDGPELSDDASPTPAKHTASPTIRPQTDGLDIRL